METRYIVCDGRGYRSVSENTEKNETFATFRSAERRAKQLARESPGETVLICEVTAECVCRVSTPETSRKNPVEDYR
jgi:hypothetical protein